MRLVNGFQALLPLFLIVVLQWGLSPASSLVSSSSSSLCPSSSKHYLDIVNVFGRLAEQKALGYTSSYDVQCCAVFIPPIAFLTLLLTLRRPMFPHLSRSGCPTYGVFVSASTSQIGGRSSRLLLLTMMMGAVLAASRRIECGSARRCGHFPSSTPLTVRYTA